MTTTAQQHPALAAEANRRHENVQLRIADAITAFAGSMTFVYLHALLFAGWMIWLEKSPWPTLTLFVSLEAIFLSTFVMIGQNRQAGFSQAKANHDFTVAEQELHENTEITRLVQQLTVEIHNHYIRRARADSHSSVARDGSHRGDAIQERERQ
ncbi:MAG: hypothetical protein QOG80_3457 [Pseudonocardiales bacterium]|jgi:uncharacterized membrane protein|nr:hypothetical protein [Pseudonocardiales bacterium]